MRRQQVSGPTAILFLEHVWNRDLSDLDPDGPLPDFDPDLSRADDHPGPGQRGQGPPRRRRREWRELAAAKGLSIRELMIEVTARQSFVGTPAQVAEQIDTLRPGGRGRRLHPGAPRHARRPRRVRRQGRPDPAGAGPLPHRLHRPDPARSSRASARPAGPRAWRAVHDRAPADEPGAGTPRRARPGARSRSGSTRRRGPAQHHRPGPAGRGSRLPALLVRRASPQPGCGRIIPGGADRPRRRRHPTHPSRLGGRAERSPHRPVGGRGVRADRRPLPRPARSGPRPLGRPQLHDRSRHGADRRRPAGAPTPGAALHRQRAADPRAAVVQAHGCNRPAWPLTAELLQQAGRRVGRLRRAARRHRRTAATAPTAQPTGSTPAPCPARARRWSCGSSAAVPARARRSPASSGLRFAANYHVSPATVLEAADAYRAAFVPSAGPRPALRGRLGRRRGRPPTTPRPGSWPPATGCGSAASAGARGPSRSRRPEEAARHRVERRRPGPRCRPGRHPVRRLTRRRWPPAWSGCRRPPGPTNWSITTITHDHADRVRSYELLAKEWFN